MYEKLVQAFPTDTTARIEDSLSTIIIETALDITIYAVYLGHGIVSLD